MIDRFDGKQNITNTKYLVGFCDELERNEHGNNLGGHVEGPDKAGII